MENQIIVVIALFLVAAVMILRKKKEGFGGPNSANGTPAPFLPLECPAFPHYYNTICGQSPVRQNTCCSVLQPSVQPTNVQYKTEYLCNSCQCQGGCLARLGNATQPIPLGCYPPTQFSQHSRPLGCARRCLLRRHYT